MSLFYVSTKACSRRTTRRTPLPRFRRAEALLDDVARASPAVGDNPNSFPNSFFIVFRRFQAVCNGCRQFSLLHPRPFSPDSQGGDRGLAVLPEAGLEPRPGGAAYAILLIGTTPASERSGSVVIPVTISIQRNPYAASSANRALAPAGIWTVRRADDQPQSQSW
jgi:hypothetical protein